MINRATGRLSFSQEPIFQAGSYVHLGGDTMTGDLTLFGPPTTDLMAATKLYVDQMISSAQSMAGSL
jgi:hypothetical protein